MWSFGSNMKGVLLSRLLYLALAAALGLVSQQTSLGQFAITTSSLPDGAAGSAYRQPLTTNAPASAVQTWSISQGVLPPGLVLGPQTGLITGIPTSSGTFNFIARATFNNGSAPASAQLQIVVSAAPPPPDIQKTSLPGGTAGVFYPAFTFGLTQGTGAAPL